jgi:Protein of unknown function (DUF3108)
MYKKMKRGSLLFFVGLFTLIACKSTEYVGKQNEIQACFAPDIAFRGGEKLTYKLYYNLSPVWVAAGEVNFSVSEEGQQYHIVAEGKTYPSYDNIFKVDDRYETYIDKHTMLPSVAIREVHEGKYNLYDKVVFNQKEHEATSYRGNSAADATKSEYDIENCMHDLLSIIYFARNVDFKNLPKDSYFPISIFMDKKAHPLRIQYKGVDSALKVKGQKKQKALLFAAQTVDGRVFPDDAQVNIWVSDDEKHIPLLIESPLSVGAVKAVLTNK